MPFRTVVQVQGNLRAMLDAAEEELSNQLRAAVQEVSTSLQKELRAQVTSAGLGRGLANAWQREVYPRTRKRTFHPAGLVYSKAQVLHDVYDRGATIVPRRGKFLVVPLPEAVRRNLHTSRTSRKGGSLGGAIPRKASMLSEAAEALGARIVSAKPGVRRRGGRSSSFRPYILLVRAKRSAHGNLVALLFASRDQERGIPLFTLIRQTAVQKRLDIDGAAQRAEAQLASAINRIGEV